MKYSNCWRTISFIILVANGKFGHKNMASTEREPCSSDVIEHVTDGEHNQSMDPVQVDDEPNGTEQNRTEQLVFFTNEPSYQARRIRRLKQCVYFLVLIICILAFVVVAVVWWTLKERNDALALTSTEARTMHYMEPSLDYFVYYEGVCPLPACGICQREIVGRTSRFEERHCEEEAGILSNETKCLKCGENCFTAENLISKKKLGGGYIWCNNTMLLITCCMVQSLAHEDICGGNGHYSCGTNLDAPPECNCFAGWNGSSCSHASVETVDCKCLRNGKRFMNELTTIKCDDDTRPKDWKRCHKEVENDTCICAPVSEGFVTYGEHGPEICNSRHGQKDELSVPSGQSLGPVASYFLTSMCVFITMYPMEMTQQPINSLTIIT